MRRQIFRQIAQKFRRQTVCLARDFWAIWRKICKQIACKAVRRALCSVSFIIPHGDIFFNTFQRTFVKIYRECHFRWKEGREKWCDCHSCDALPFSSRVSELFSFFASFFLFSKEKKKRNSLWNRLIAVESNPSVTCGDSSARGTPFGCPKGEPSNTSLQTP